jgi:hypothetical protein
LKRFLYNRSLPLILIAIGLIWLFVLTFLNMMYGYYGWLGTFVEHPNDTWSKQEVSQLLVRFGTSVRDRVGSQVFPLVLILVGAILSAIHQRRSTKHNKSAHPTAGNVSV